MLPGLLVVAPPTVRFAFARARLADEGWEPAYRLPRGGGRAWWRSLRLAASRGELHPCAERLARHISWHLEDRVTLTDVRVLLERYAAHHGLSLRTAWTDWGRLVEAGWLAPTRAPANQGQGHPQGPGSGRAARYVLTAPAAVITQLQPRASREQPTALDSFSSLEVSPSPSVPPPRHDHQGEWITLRRPTPIERRDASALLAGGQERWRRQRRDSELLTRQDWERLLPLAAEAQRQRPDVDLSGLLTDRVASARHLPAVLAWRLRRLLRELPPHSTPLTKSPTPPDHIEDLDDWHQHLTAVHTLGGPAAARAALATAQSHPASCSPSSANGSGWDSSPTPASAPTHSTRHPALRPRQPR